MDLGRRLDLVGGALAIALALWGLFAGRVDDARPGPFAAAVALAAAAHVAGRLAARTDAALPFGAAAVGVGIAVLAAGTELRDVTGPPLGYQNANGALLVLGAIGATTTATMFRRGPLAIGFGTGAAVLVAATLATRSLAAALALALALAVVAAGWWWRDARLAVAAAAIASLLVLLSTVGLAARGEPLDQGEAATVRQELWEGALDVMRDHPFDGVGPGRFEEVNPVTDDRDLRFGHHGFLEQGAEQGVVGLLLLLALVAWMLARTWAAAAVSSFAGVGAAAVAAVVLQANVDYVLRYPAVTAVVALLHGGAVGLAERPFRRSAPPQPPQPPQPPPPSPPA